MIPRAILISWMLIATSAWAQHGPPPDPADLADPELGAQVSYGVVPGLGVQATGIYAVARQRRFDVVAGYGESAIEGFEEDVRAWTLNGGFHYTPGIRLLFGGGYTWFFDRNYENEGAAVFIERWGPSSGVSFGAPIVRGSWLFQPAAAYTMNLRFEKFEAYDRTHRYAPVSDVYVDHTLAGGVSARTGPGYATVFVQRATNGGGTTSVIARAGVLF